MRAHNLVRIGEISGCTNCILYNVIDALTEGRAQRREQIWPEHTERRMIWGKVKIKCAKAIGKKEI